LRPGADLMHSQRPENDAVWPALPYADWQDTCTTLHMCTQVIGKVKLALTPFLNAWWNVAFGLSARGLTSGTIPFGQQVFQVDFDFIDHRVGIHTSAGLSASIPLVARPVAEFYVDVMQALESLDIRVRINTLPAEVDNPIRFEDDRQHA